MMAADFMMGRFAKLRRKPSSLARLTPLSERVHVAETRGFLRRPEWAIRSFLTTYRICRRQRFSPSQLPPAARLYLEQFLPCPLGPGRLRTAASLRRRVPMLAKWRARNP